MNKLGLKNVKLAAASSFLICIPERRDVKFSVLSQVVIAN